MCTYHLVSYLGVVLWLFFIPFFFFCSFVIWSLFLVLCLGSFFFFVCVSIIDFWFMVNCATYFHKKYRKRQKYNKKLTTVSLFKANQGKNLNIPLQVLSNIYISVIKMFICIVSFLLLTLIYYHKLTNIFFFTGYINIHLLLH